MNKLEKIAIITLTIIFTVFLCVSCKDDPAVLVTGVQLDKESMTLAAGNEKTLVATVTPENATNKKVTWTSSDTAVATVDQNGKVSGVAEGETTITVTTEDGGKTATCKVTVGTVHVTGVTLSEESTTVNIGTPKKLVATVSPEDASDKAVKWSSSKKEIATVDEDGVVTGLKEGTATITVTTEDGGFTDTCEVTVVFVHVTGVALDETSTTVNIGTPKKLIATISPEDASDKSVKWTSSNTSVATVDKNGVVSGQANGEATITATTVDGGFKATCEVTVETVAVESVSLNKHNCAIAPTKTETLVATVLPNNASYPAVTWQSNNTDVATVNYSGVVTAKAKGTATITVKSQSDPTKSDTCTVIVPEFNINESDIVVYKNTPVELTVTKYPEDATVTWTSSDTTIATVDAGVVTAIATGYATITASITVDSTVFSDTCEVAVAGIALDKKTMALGTGQADTLTATVIPSTAGTVTWESNNTDVATVTTNGVVAAVSEGTATITASITIGTVEYSDTCVVTVTDSKKLPLTLEFLEEGNVTLTKQGNPGDVYYSLDFGNTKTIASFDTPIPVPAGGKISFYRDLANDLTVGNYFTITNNNYCYVYGNVMSLIDSVNYESATTVYAYAFNSLFMWNENIINHENLDLILPATTLATGCYQLMFNSCSRLSRITCLATNIEATNCLAYWMNNAGFYTGGVFYRNESLDNTNDIWYHQIPKYWSIKPKFTTPVTGVNLDKENLTIIAKEGALLTETVLPENAANKNVTWTSDHTDIATVDSNGYVTAVARGSATITVTTEDGNYTDTCDVTVINELDLPLTLKYTGNGNLSITNPSSTLKYTKNGGDKTSYSSPISVSNGDKIELYSNGTGSNADAQMVINSTAYCYVYGNVMSLIDPENYATTSVVPDHAFHSLFEGNESIRNHAYLDLVLPATTLAENCYQSMFKGCTALTTAPVLPAETLAPQCYKNMFEDCAGLTTAPTLPAETLAQNCYSYMFAKCTGLKTAPALPAETLAPQCYSYMFSDCTALTTAPALSVLILTEGCYKNMFEGCTSLKTAPALPATTLAESCYESMFSGCENLTTVPEELPAESAADYCYKYMFYACTSLKTAPALPTTTLAEGCYYGMFYNCESLTTVPTLPAPTLAASCYKDMFVGCASLNSITCLATNIEAVNCTSNWVNGVAEEGTFTKDSNATWPRNKSGIPFYWEVQDYQPPTP